MRNVIVIFMYAVKLYYSTSVKTPRKYDMHIECIIGYWTRYFKLKVTKMLQLNVFVSINLPRFTFLLLLLACGVSCLSASISDAKQLVGSHICYILTANNFVGCA